MRTVIFLTALMLLFPLTSFSSPSAEQANSPIRIAISMNEEHQANISCASGTPFGIVRQVASVLPENGYSNIHLDITSTGKISNTTDTWILIEIQKSSGRICASPSLHFTCISAIVDRLAADSQVQFTLVSRDRLMNDHFEWIETK